MRKKKRKENQGFIILLCVLISLVLFALYTMRAKQRKSKEDATSLEQKISWIVDDFHSYYADTSGRFNLLVELLENLSQADGRTEINTLQDFAETFNTFYPDRYYLILGDTVHGKVSVELVRTVNDSLFTCTVNNLCNSEQLKKIDLSSVFYGESPTILFVESVLVDSYERWKRSKNSKNVPHLDYPDILFVIKDRVVAEMKLRKGI